MDVLNKVAPRYGFCHCENSTRVITIKKINHFYSKVVFSCDFAIVYNYVDNKGKKCQQYIRFNKKHGSYTWEEQPHPYCLDQKVEWIKEKGL